jgi:DNA polymerase-3 subunit beta
VKFICEKSALVKEIAIAQEISAKTTMNVLSNVYLEAGEGTLIIRSTDVTVYFQTQVPVTVVEPGTALARGDIFLRILNSVQDGELEFEKVDAKIVIKPVSKKAKFQLKSNVTEQYPSAPTVENPLTFTMAIKDFKEMIAQTIFAVSDDETRYLMNGVSFEKSTDESSGETKVIMVSTDGRRMAYIEKSAPADVPDFKGIIIPSKILSIVQRHSGEEGDIKLEIAPQNVFISFGSYHFCSSLIEGTFPDYRRVIPTEHDKSFIANRQELLDALKRVSLLVEQRNRRISLRLEENELSIFAQDMDVGDANESITATYTGEPTTIALNYRYLEEPCKAINADEILISFRDPVKAILLKPEPEEDFFHVIMPMQPEV